MAKKNSMKRKITVDSPEKDGDRDDIAIEADTLKSQITSTSK
jgi:hypothetical protein